MDSTRTVECFTFTFGILVFLFPVNFLTQAKCMQIFQKRSERLNKLASENLYASNALGKLKLGPFESVDDRLYKPWFFFKEKSRNELKKMTEIFVDNSQQTEERKGDDEETSNFRGKKEAGNKMYEANNLNEAELRNIFSPQQQTFSSISFYLRNEIDKMKLQIEKFKKLFLLLSNSPTNVQGLENLESLEKLLPLLQIKLEEELSKTTTDNRLQIGSVFFINELQVEDSRKESDTQSTMKEVLNKLKEDVVFPSPNPLETLYTNAKPYDLSLIEQFLEMFPNQYVTPEQLNQMSKIIDFVERYHGVVGNLESMDF